MNRFFTFDVVGEKEPEEDEEVDWEEEGRGGFRAERFISSPKEIVFDAPELASEVEGNVSVASDDERLCRRSVSE